MKSGANLVLGGCVAERGRVNAFDMLLEFLAGGPNTSPPGERGEPENTQCKRDPDGDSTNSLYIKETAERTRDKSPACWWREGDQQRR